VWECFSWNGLGSLVILHGTINAGYKDILTRCILSTVEDKFSDDNTPCHKSRDVKEWSVTIMFQKWTAQPRVLT
jgi:hypothetical protein